ncbi:hypothetical protein M405DRAFT_885155 [Rhizopogon salebrosus TDB-379]|nr:hypothetical protein M405DRAFT_885155 [Rhizopogon salebrosus TDB-379]
MINYGLPEPEATSAAAFISVYISSQLIVFVAYGTSTYKVPRSRSQQSFPSEFPTDFDYKEQSVVVSNAVPGKATLVTLNRVPVRLIELLCGKAKHDEVVGPMIFPADIGYPF